MPVTYVEKSTTGLLEITSDPVASPSQWSFYEEHIVAWLGEICNMTLDTGNIISGSGYQDGIYSDVELVRTATTQKGGKNLKCSVTVTRGGVSDVQITQKGNGFKAGDYLYIPDLAQVGGTGAGFQIQVASGDASIGLIKGPSDRDNLASYPVAIQMGVERTDSYTFGLLINRSSSTTTTYTYDVYNYTSTSPNSNNGYGTYSYQQNDSIAMWTDSLGDGALLAVFYCSDPGNEFFFATDSSYAETWGVFKAKQDPSGNWPDPAIVSSWVSINGPETVTDYRPLLSTYYSTNYTGASKSLWPAPSDTGVLFNNFNLRGRAYSVGVSPDRLYTATGGRPWGHIYQDGADSYRRVHDNLYIRMN